MDSLHLLTVITFLPALAAVILAAIPDEKGVIARPVSLAASLLVCALSAVLWVGFDPNVAGLQYVEDYDWIVSLGIRYHVGIDGIGLAMVVLTAVTTPLAILCSWSAIQKAPRGFFIAVLLLETGMLGVFTAADLFLFYVYWEVMLLPMALMIGIWGGPRRIYASVKFVLYTLFGSLLMLVAILYCVNAMAHTKTGITFDIFTMQQVLRVPGVIPHSVQMWLFLAFALSFAIKVPMFPFHTWLPDAHVEAPTAGSVILAAVLLKMGCYGFLRFAIPFFPEAAQAAAPVAIALCVIGIIYGSLMSMAQRDIKKLIAYSSVAHLGFVMLGIFSGNVTAAQGGVLQMINHGVSTGALFLLVGVVYERTHVRGVEDFGGLAKTMPVYATLFLIVALSSIGLPGTNGFVGEFLILIGTFQTYPVAAGIGAFGVVLGAAYMLTLYRNMFFGKARNPAFAALPEPNVVELASLLPLVVLIFVLGLMPNLVLSRTEGPVARVMHDLQPDDARVGVTP
jgi:NADH-quinone oxidoreductase subunit M